MDFESPPMFRLLVVRSLEGIDHREISRRRR